jgi:outer membrane protein assembly factor BamB
METTGHYPQNMGKAAHRMRQHRLSFILFGLLVSTLLTTTSAQDWPQFRGQDSLGIGRASHLPTTWSDTDNLAWKTALPGAGASSPIALNGKLYLTCYSGYGIEGVDGTLEALTLHLICVDVSTGNVLWQRLFPVIELLFQPNKTMN